MIKESLSYFFLTKLILSNRSNSLIRRISVLSFTTISLSVALFFIVLFVMNAMNENIKNRIIELEPHLTIRLSNSASQAKNLQKQFLFEHKILFNETQATLEFDEFDLILRTYDGQFHGTKALGYDQEGIDFWILQLQNLKIKKTLAENQKQFTTEGSDINEFIKEEKSKKLELGPGEIALGVDLARSLELLEGDQLTLIPAESLLMSSLETPLFEKVTVKKIISTDLFEIDSKLLLFNKSLTLKSFNQSASKFSGFHLWLEKIDKVDSLKDKFQNLKSTKNNSDISLRPSVDSVLTWKEQNAELFFALFLEKTMIGLILGIAGLVASSSILTVLALVMSQKKIDIAIIKTLGFSNKKTLKLFVSMGLWISLSALLLGTSIGLAVSFYLQAYPLNILPQIYYDATIPAKVNFELLLWVLLGVSSLAALGCYIPARASLKIDPGLLLKSKN